MSQPYLYALRVCVAPGFFVREKLEQVRAFCEAGGVREVILFANYEELNTGHVTPEEQAQWLDVYREAQQVLGPAGIALSLNPWETILHADRGRTLHPSQRFRRMVDVAGQEATACVCPLGTEWQAYLVATYVRYASVAPRVLWIEDDFRFHNHAPLKWGGCFCDAHLNLISERYGANVSREVLVEAITAPGPPHPLRQVWLDVNGETLVELARRITLAVKAVSPETRMGLMTSVPSVHAAEGRRWPELVAALGEDCVVRPHLPAYREVPPGQYLWRFTLSRQTAALLPPQITLLPELDNGPHSLFSKSRALTGFQIPLASVLDSTGITMNILDPTGNGPLLGEGYQETLARLRPFLNAVLGLGLHRDQLAGIRVPFSPLSATTLHTESRYRATQPRYDLGQEPGGQIGWLYPDEGKWASLLSCFGLSTAITTREEFTGETVAISGQWLRNLTPGQLGQLFQANAILLDGAAAVTLCDMGLGYLAGIQGVRSIEPQDNGLVAYEEVVDGTVLLGNRQARFSAQGSTGPAAIFDYLPDARVVTELRDYTGETTGPGIVFGTPRCLVVPYLFPDSPDTCLLSTLRKELFLTLLSRLVLAPQQLSFCPDQAYTCLYRYELPEATVALLANASTDEVVEPSLHLGGLPDGNLAAEVCDHDGAVIRQTLAFTEGNATLPLSMPPMTMLALLLPRRAR